MRKKVFFLIALAILFLPAAGAKVEQSQKKFKFVYTITYNEITLEEAAALEKIIKRQNKNACSVDTQVKDVVVTFETYFKTANFTSSKYFE